MNRASMASTFSALLLIFALINWSEARTQDDSFISGDLYKTVNFGELVTDLELSQQLTVSGGKDGAARPIWSRQKVWYGKVPFCNKHVWVSLKPEDKLKKKASCPWPATPVPTTACGLSACTTVFENEVPWYKSHAPAPSHHHHEHDHDKDGEHHKWRHALGPAPAPGHGGRDTYRRNAPKPTCSSNWKVKGYEVTLHMFEGRPERGDWGRKEGSFMKLPNWGQQPCAWVPTNGARVLLCVKCPGPSKRPPVLKTYETSSLISLRDHGDEPVERFGKKTLSQVDPMPIMAEP